MPPKNLVLSKLKFFRKKWELLNIHHAKGAQIRSRTKWVEEGEKNTKYFLGLEKARAVRNTITQLKTDSGTLIDSQNQIHHKITDYYKEIYKKKVNFQTEISQFNNFISNLKIPQISNEYKPKCDETRTTRTPAFWDTPRHPMITHTSDSHQIPSQNNTKSKSQILKNCQNFKFCKKLCTRHTFWSCFIRCINMKWIQPEL